MNTDYGKHSIRPKNVKTNSELPPEDAAKDAFVDATMIPVAQDDRIVTDHQLGLLEDK